MLGIQSAVGRSLASQNLAFPKRKTNLHDARYKSEPLGVASKKIDRPSEDCGGRHFKNHHSLHPSVSGVAWSFSILSASMKVVAVVSFAVCSIVVGQENDACVVAGGDESSCRPKPTWNIHDDHPCNIDIFSPEDFASAFPDGFPTYYEKPFVLRDPHRNAVFQELSNRENVPSLFVGGKTKLPEANLFSFAKTEVSVEEFINSPEVTSWDYANETLYMLTNIEDFSAYVPPPGQAKILDPRIGIGSLGSGVQWHRHGPGFCEVTHGRKHWLLTDSDSRIDYDAKRPSRHWFEYMFTTYQASKIWECTLHAGDAIYFPDNWWHTTVNLDAYTSFVTIFYDVKR